jgi:hypothetical protein
MKSLILTAIAAVTIVCSGCGTTTTTGTSGSLGNVIHSIGNIDPGNIGLVLSQMNQNVTVQLTTAYGNFTGVRTVPGAVNSTPIVPLTATQQASVLADPFAAFLYSFRNDTSSQHITWQGIGGTAIIDISMPPATNPVIVTTTNSVTIPVTSSVSVTQTK